MTTNTERRKFSRIPMDFRVEVVAGDKQYSSKLIDISLKGALIERPDSWDEDQRDSIDLVIHGDNDAYEIRMTTRPGHIEDQFIGLECKEIDIDSITHLRRLVELNLGDSSILDREFAELCRH